MVAGNYGPFHARVLEGVNSFQPCQDTVSPFENNCLEGEMTFGDPFEDSGVVAVPLLKTKLLRSVNYGVAPKGGLVGFTTAGFREMPPYRIQHGLHPAP